MIAADSTDPSAYVLVLLALEGGLRLAEMVALEWANIDVAKGYCACSGPKGQAFAENDLIGGERGIRDERSETLSGFEPSRGESRALA